MQSSGPATANFYKPTQLELSFIHSGHVLVRLLTRNHRELAATQLQLTDQAGIARTLTGWAATTFADAPQGSHQGTTTSLEYRDGFRVVLTDGIFQDTQEFAVIWRPLQADFTATVAGGLGSKDPEAAHAFGNHGAQKFAEFFAAAQSECHRQLAGSSYDLALAGYLKTTLSKVAPEDQNYFNEWQRTIGAELQSKEYLRLAQDQYVRDLYVAILKRGQQLYNWSQMLSKSGISSSFEDRM